MRSTFAVANDIGGKFVKFILRAFLLISVLASRPVLSAEAPAEIPVDAFVESGSLVQPIISPNGEKIAFRERVGERTYVSFRPVDTEEIARVAFPEGYDLNWYRWAGDTKLLISATRKSIF